MTADHPQLLAELLQMVGFVLASVEGPRTVHIGRTYSQYGADVVPENDPFIKLRAAAAAVKAETDRAVVIDVGTAAGIARDACQQAAHAALAPLREWYDEVGVEFFDIVHDHISLLVPQHAEDLRALAAVLRDTLSQPDAGC